MLLLLFDKSSFQSENNYLAFVRTNLFACLLEVISTFCLFREINSGLQRYIDLKHLYGGLVLNLSSDFEL